MTWWGERGFWVFLILQLPEILLAGLILSLLHWWVGLSLTWVMGLVALWVGKDLGIYLLLRKLVVPPRTGPEALVGARAIADERLAPEGYVRMGPERWMAKALPPQQDIPRGTTVIVRATRGLTLLVEAEGPVGTLEGTGTVP